MKKEKIIEASRSLFHRFGFKKVSMDEIAKESGVTKKTIYMYFSSKEELLKYFIEEEIEYMRNILEDVEKQNLDFFQTVNHAIYKLLKYRRERDFLSTIEKEAEWLKNPIVVQNLHLIDEKIQEYIKEKLKQAKEKGDIYFEDLDIVTFLVYKMYMALMFEWNEKLDEQKIADNLSSILKNGLRKEV